MKRTKKTSVRVAQHSATIAALAPAVAGARLVRMAAKGDASPLGSMAVEKASVFASAATGMMFAGAGAFAECATLFARLWMPGPGSPLERGLRFQAALGHVGLSAVAAAIAPVHKRVVKNSRRLGR